MKKCCKGESSAHSIPRTRFTNLLGSDRDKELRSSSEDAECNNEALTEESAGQRMINAMDPLALAHTIDKSGRACGSW